jgi:hypothetical protein
MGPNDIVSGFLCNALKKHAVSSIKKQAHAREPVFAFMKAGV